MNKGTKCTADNSGLPSVIFRGHTSGGVFLQIVLWEFGSLSPARTFVEPTPCEAAIPLQASELTVSLENSVENDLNGEIFVDLEKF